MRGWMIFEYLDSQLWSPKAWWISLVWRSWFHPVWCVGWMIFRFGGWCVICLESLVSHFSGSFSSGCIFPSYGDGWSSLVLQMLEDALDPVATEGSFTFVGSLVGDGIFMWLETLTSLGFKGSLVEIMFMLLFDMLSWWLLCHDFLCIASLELWHDTIIWYDYMKHVISLEEMF